MAATLEWKVWVLIPLLIYVVILILFHSILFLFFKFLRGRIILVLHCCTGRTVLRTLLHVRIQQVSGAFTNCLISKGHKTHIFFWGFYTLLGNLNFCFWSIWIFVQVCVWGSSLVSFFCVDSYPQDHLLKRLFFTEQLDLNFLQISV